MIYDWSNKRVLLVEDTKVNIDLMLIMLKSTKIKVDVVKSGEEFLNKIYQNKYDIVLMDISLQGQYSGYDLIRYMHKNSIHVPIIIQSANPECVHINNEIYEDFVTKPIKYELLFEKMNRYFNRIITD